MALCDEYHILPHPSTYVYLDRCDDPLPHLAMVAPFTAPRGLPDVQQSNAAVKRGTAGGHPALPSASRTARQRICDFVALWSLADQPFLNMGRPERYITTSRMTWNYPWNG